MLSVNRGAPSLAVKNSSAARVAVSAAALALIASPALPLQAVTAAAAPGDTVTVDFPYVVSGDQYEWVVPAGVTEVTIAVAAGSGASAGGGVGGAGGAITALVPVTPGQTLLVRVGAQGVTTPLMTGGQGSAVATADGDLLVVAGGGGASFRCGEAVVTNETCGDGGAGGFSALSGSASGLRGSPPPLPAAIDTAATLSGPGASGDQVFNGTPEFWGTVVPSPDAATVVAGVLTLAPSTAPPLDSIPVQGLAAGGGGGYYAGGHGGQTYDPSIDPVFDRLAGGGGGGGSGYLIASASLVTLANNVGNGFASISYVEPAGTGSDRELAATGTPRELGFAGVAALALVGLGAILLFSRRRAGSIS